MTDDRTPKMPGTNRMNDQNNEHEAMKARNDMHFDESHVPVNERPSSRFRTVGRRLAFLLVAAAVITGVWSLKKHHPVRPAAVVPPTPSDQERREHFVKAVRHAIQHARERDAQAWHRFQQKLEQAGLSPDEAEEYVDRFITHISSLESLKTIALASLRDRFKHQNSLQQYMEQQIDQDIRKPLLESREQRLREALDELAVSIRENDTRLQEDLRRILDTIHAPDGGPLLPPEQEQELHDILNELQSSLQTEILTGAGLVFGVATSQELARCIWYVVRSAFLPAVERVVARFLSKSAAVSWLPVADGPLPIGDVAWGLLEAAFLAWDVHGLHKAVTKVRHTLHDQLRDALIQWDEKARDNVLRQGVDLLRRHQESIQQNEQRLTETIAGDTET